MKKCTLHIYWDDDATIELRDFPTKEAAKNYAKANACENYLID